MDTLEERIAEIERRLSLLEASYGLQGSGSAASALPPELPKKSLVALSVSNKRYDHGDYEDHIWFDCTYTLSAASKPTRAVKGAIQFSDLFGDVKFRLLVTVNDALSPDKPLVNPGIGFTFNQFMGEHQWMQATNLTDMKCSFAVSNVLYSDGTSEAFA
ncbi:hypothetical protein [Rhodanobacter soli]|uniref:Uncharacterized protein n=1 Tax=Rhodanobacter soli TaxID=590609 RepID=A0ABV2PTY5_9GAMM